MYYKMVPYKKACNGIRRNELQLRSTSATSNGAYLELSLCRAIFQVPRVFELTFLYK